MKKREKIIVILFVAVLVLVIGMSVRDNRNNKYTGKVTTYTSGADYKRLHTDHDFIGCVNTTRNDGWDVTAKESIQCYNKNEEKWTLLTDSCEDVKTVLEYNIDGFTKYMMWRHVKCPTGMICKEGVCISE